ncbi:CPK2, partial [Symbiodinium sp. CCMP2456]
MGAALAAACARVEQPAATGDQTESLQAFDRALLAQVKKGKLEDNYEMLEELGSGSFGVVSRARDIRTKAVSMATYVAVKTIPKKKISDPKTVKDEFNVLRQLDHAHICKAYECYEDRRHIYLVMDICAGGTLLESLCVQQRFPEPDAAKIMRQTLSALSYLHQANFIFRDLKTENIMFAKPVQDGEVGNIKLIDFGLCCPFRPGAKITRAAGTPYSVAPELVTAPVQYDQRCDSWSAGVVMFIILSGQYPFSGKTKEELLHKIRKEPVSFKSARWKKITKEGTDGADLVGLGSEWPCLYKGGQCILAQISYNRPPVDATAGEPAPSQNRLLNGSVGSEDLGIHNFMVQIRDLQTHEPLPGVQVGDIGPKIGYNNQDNGFCRFSHVRIPRTNMAMRHATLDRRGQYSSRKERRAASYSAMTKVRVEIAMGSGHVLSKACAIAIRYSAVRHQGFTGNGDSSEMCVLDYTMQQQRVLPLLATAYAFHF